MKLWQKIFLGAFLTSVVMFFFFGITIVIMGLNSILEGEMQRTEYYQSVYAGKAADFIEETGSEEQLFAYLEEFRGELEGEGRYLQVWVDGNLSYDQFCRFPEEPRYSFTEEVQAAYTPTYMKDIGDSRFLYVESEFPGNHTVYKLTMIKDLSEIYDSYNMQFSIFFAICLFQAFISAMVMFLIIKGITEPIERLTQAVKLMTQESVPLQLPVESEDEIGELSEQFNLMARTINGNIDNYKQIIGNLTHEIKTPLTSIIGYAQLLKDNHCDREMEKEALDYILEEGKRLNSLTRKMIHLSRIQPGLLNIERQLIDKLIELSVMAVKIKARNKSIHFQIQGAVQVYGYVDRELIITMLENVLDNAIKASGEDGLIRIEVAADKDFLSEISVTDYGVGIPEDRLDKIAQPFYTGDKARAWQEDGFGMGLAICQSVMNYHHGALHFRSVLGEFTCVTMSFPSGHYQQMEGIQEEAREMSSGVLVSEAARLMQ